MLPVQGVTTGEGEGEHSSPVRWWQYTAFMALHCSQDEDSRGVRGVCRGDTARTGGGGGRWPGGESIAT